MFKKIKGMVILTMLFCLCGCSKKENQPLDSERKNKYIF